MKTDLLPRSNGDFRFGAETYRKKLLYDEMVDTPLDRLLAVNDTNMKANQAEFARIAKELDPQKTPAEVLAQLATIHPAPDKLLDAFRDSFNAEIAFIQAHGIITLPSPVRPVLEETPPFERATTSASMDPPGPFETHSTKAYFNVTLPEKGWTPEHIAEHMAEFNVGTIVSTSVHEAYPGHYVQFLWQDRFPSKIRKLLGANTNIEGWAHYCEQMMLDEGFRDAGQRRARTQADPPRSTAGRAAAQCALCGRHQNAHRGLDYRAGRAVLCARRATSRRPSRRWKPSAAPPTRRTCTTRWANWRF